MFRKPKKHLKSSVKSSIDNEHTIEVAYKEDHGRKVFRKRSRDNNNNNLDGSSSDDGDCSQESTTDNVFDQIAREKKSKKVHNDEGDTSGKVKSLMHQFGSTDPSERPTAKEFATRAAEFHPSERTIAASQPDDTAETDGTAKLYRGTKETRNKFLAGPLKAPTFVRTTCRFDYQPDICKDYKDTGFCGFGDTCIYLHDRGDTMSGWQIEAQWEERKKKEQEQKEKEIERFLAPDIGADALNEEDERLVEEAKGDLPFACYLCRGPFTDPIVTTCGHYFCQTCVLERIRLEAAAGATKEGGTSATLASDCPICGKDTHGIFNHPSKLVAKKRKLVGSNGTWDEFAEKAKTIRQPVENDD